MGIRPCAEDRVQDPRGRRRPHPSGYVLGTKRTARVLTTISLSTQSLDPVCQCICNLRRAGKWQHLNSSTPCSIIRKVEHVLMVLDVAHLFWLGSFVSHADSAV